MKNNLGVTDRILRFALAFWFLGPFSPEFMAPWANAVIAVIGLIALIESFIGWCGLQQLLGITHKNN